MVIFLAVIVMIIAIIVLCIKYFKTYAKLVSHKSYDKEAQKRAAQLKHSDPIITCDYCGAKIDTRITKVCTQCGADFGKDKEWEERHNPNYKWADENAEENYDKELTAAEKNAQIIAKRLKMWIFALAVCVVLLVGIAVLMMVINRVFIYAHDEKLNRYSTEDYVLADYVVEGDGVVYDAEGIKVTITGLYENKKFPNDPVKVEYMIENSNDTKKRIVLETGFINGLDFGDYYYEWIKKNDTVRHYVTARTAGDPVKEIAFIQFKVEADEYASIDDYSDTDPVYIRTTADYEVNVSFDDEAVIFDNEYMTVYYDENETEARHNNNIYFDVKNKSDKEWRVSCSNYVLFNGEKYEGASGCRESRVIPGGVLSNIYVGSGWSGLEFSKRSADDSIELSISFLCVEDPSLDFSTGYINYNQGK